MTIPDAIAGRLGADEQVLWIGRPRQGLWDGTGSQLFQAAFFLSGFLFFMRLFVIGLASGEIGNPNRAGNHPLEWVILSGLIAWFGFAVWQVMVRDRRTRRQTWFVLTPRRMFRQIGQTKALVSWVMLKPSGVATQTDLKSLELGKRSLVYMNGRNMADRIEGPTEYMPLHLDEPAGPVIALITK